MQETAKRPRTSQAGGRGLLSRCNSRQLMPSQEEIFNWSPSKKRGTNPKLRGVWPYGKDPRGNTRPGFTSRQDGAKILRGKIGVPPTPPTLSRLEPKERGQEKSTRAEVSSAAAPQVRRSEQLLLLREFPPRTRLWVLETTQSREPTVPEPPGVPAVGREGRSRLGERKSSKGQVWGRRDVLL